ncbi:glucosaminidase domain-containing protein [Parasutterella excrementihominis]|nr:phage tail protein [Parasutterella excrementihominis]
MKTEETETTIRCYCENLNLELLNEMAGPYKAKTKMSFVEYCNAFGLLVFGAITIGHNEIEDRERTLEWTGTDTKLKRLLSIANKFDAEIEFETILDEDSSLKSFILHIYKENDDKNQGVGKVREDVVLRHGYNIEGVKRTIDKTGIFNMITPVGKATVDVEVTKANPKYVAPKLNAVTYSGGGLSNGGRTISKSLVNEILNLCVQHKLLPSGVFSQMYLESFWGNSPVARADNNWGGLTWTGSGNRPSGIKVTQGTARPANEGGYYMHFSSVSDYFKDYTYLLAEQGIYKVKGANNIDAYTKGLFRFGGAAYDYAAAGYGHYAPLMRSIRNGINSASNGAMDTLDNQFKTAGTVGTAPVSQKADKVISVLNALTAKKGTRIGSGQCYGLVAWHAMSIGGPGLGGGVTGLRGLIGAGAAASHIGEDYNWSQFGWKVVRPSQVNHLIPGSIANIRANAGGPVWTGGWGHTVVIKGLSGDTLTVLEQNYAGRQWVEERTYSASAYLRIIQTLCYPPEIVQGKRIDGTESSPAPSGTPGNNEPKTISETQQQEKTVGIPADLYREWKNEDGVVEFYIKNGSIYAPISKELYPSAFTGEEISDNWIRKNVEYETIDVEKMISYSLQDIRKNCYPSISYEVKGTDENLDMGDTVKIDDEEFPGGLVLSARVSEQHISFTNDGTNQTVFDNYKALKNKLSKDLINRYEELAEQAKPFELRPITDKGTTFKNSTGLSVLTAELWKSNKQYDATFQFRNFDTLLASGLTYTVDGSTVPIDKPFLVSIDAFIGNGLVATRQITFTNVMDGPKGDKGDKGALDETQVKEITDKIDTKSDQAMTQEQLNLLLETQNLMTAEMKSKATAEQVDALFASYNKYVSDESVNKANTEAALIANAERIEAFRKDFDDKMVQLDFVSNYMRVTDLGFEISANDGSSSLLIQKDRISMFSAGKEVMYISQGLIHIDNGVFTKTLQIGNFRESQLDGDSTTNVTIYVS